MQLEAGRDRLHGLLGRARQQVQTTESAARRDAVGIRVDRPLVELRGFTKITEPLGDQAIVIARDAVGGCDLQRVAKLDARLLEISGRELGLAFGNVLCLARGRPATAGHR